MKIYFEIDVDESVVCSAPDLGHLEKMICDKAVEEASAAFRDIIKQVNAE